MENNKEQANTEISPIFPLLLSFLATGFGSGTSSYQPPININISVYTNENEKGKCKCKCEKN